MIDPQTIAAVTAAFPALAWSEFRGDTRVVVPSDSLFDCCEFLRDVRRFDLLVDVTCVDYLNYRDAEHRFGLVYLLAATETNERITVRAFVNEPASDRRFGRAAVGRGQLDGARSVGHVRHSLRGAPRPAADSASR